MTYILHKEMWSVFIIYDNPLFAHGLEQLLRQEGVDVLGSAARARQALVHIKRLRPDVIITEVKKEKSKAEMLLSWLLHEQLQAKVLRVSLDDNTATLYTARRWATNTVEDLVEGVLTLMVP